MPAAKKKAPSRRKPAANKSTYDKLISRGMSPKQAEAFSKHTRGTGGKKKATTKAATKKKRTTKGK